MSHLVGDPVQLRELCDRLLNKFRIDKIGEAGDGLFLDAIELAGGAISLQRSDIAGEAGVGEPLGGLVEGERKPCRGRARYVGLMLSVFVGHCRQHTTGATHSALLSTLEGVRHNLCINSGRSDGTNGYCLRNSSSISAHFCMSSTRSGQ